MKVEQCIRDEVPHLSGDDPSRRAQALAGIVVLLTQLQEPSVPEELISQLPLLKGLVAHEDPNLRANACAVLSGLMSLSDELQERVLSDGLVGELAAQLRAATSSGGQGTLQLNVLACMTEALRDRDASADELAAAGGLQAVVGLCDPELAERVQEAAADVVCAVATVEAHKGALVEQGAVGALCKLLATPNHEVRVRALMGLGMLLPNNTAAQVAVAKDKTAVGNLMALMRQQDDQDCRIIARDIFSGLAASKDCKDMIAEAIRS